MKSYLNRKNFFVVLLCAAALCITGAVANGRTITVRADGNGDYPTIQDAIDDCNDGDEVVVCDGRYTGYGNRSIEFKGKAITVRSENGPGSCIIDSGNQCEVFRFYFSREGPSSVVCGFTITGARNGTSGHYGGGGILIMHASPTIKNCIITGNTIYGYSEKTAYGGGVYIDVGSHPTIENCIITENVALGGDGRDQIMGIEPPVIGTPGGSAYGGGIYCSGSAIIKNCIISNNICDGGKGGDSPYAGPGGDGGDACGGGMCISNSTIKNCTITGNRVYRGARGGPYSWPSENGDALGRELYCSGVSVKIQNSIIWSSGEEGIYGNPIVIYSDVKGGYEGVGNISASPYFVGGDYRLWPESPCIDAGDPNYVTGPNETDLYGNPRVIGGRVDMGAYEFSHDDFILVRFEITGPDKVREYSSAQYKAIAYYDNGETRDVTTWSAWSLQPPSCGSINNGLLITERIETTEYITICAQYSAVGVTVKAETTVQVAVPVDLEITGPQLIPSDSQTQYKAVVRYDNNQNRNVTDSAVWLVEPNDLVSIEAGLLRAGDVNEPEDITIYSQYTAGGATAEAEILVQVVPPRILHVPANYETIQSAIDDCLDHDTVIVASGIYTGDGNRDIDFKGKAITVRSTDPNDPNIITATVIDCEASKYDRHRGFKFESGEGPNSVLAGFTIINGYARYGGAIFCDTSSPTITHCRIEGNSVWHGGGGIYCGSATITNCIISENNGGGISCWNATITNCIISNNSSSSSGGGISCGSAMITNCIIRGNSAEGDYGSGGGIRYWDGGPTITNCIITGNRTSEYGGGICGDWFVKDNAAIINCTITGNFAESYGGGLAGSGGTIDNCVITGNRAERYGGGGISDCWGPITNCTIIGNLVGTDLGEGYGGGLAGCDGPVTNCIIWGNGPEQIYRSDSVTYSNVQGGWEGEGNIDAAPIFALDTDYHLMPGSPCIDAGTNDPCGGLPATDKDGVARPLDGDGDANAVADMGAYEYAPNSPSIAVSALSFYFVQDWPKPDPQTLQIRNCGGRPLNWEIIEDCSWLEVAPANGVSTDQINEVTITVAPNGLMPGLYSCTFNVQDANASNSPVTIRVIMPVGTVLRVPSLDFPTIQAAIDAADNYDVVLVADGNYTGPGNKNLNFHGKPITVCSENGTNNCTIDCENSGDGFFFQNGEKENSVVDGFTITNARSGILCEESSPAINNCTIRENSNYGILSYDQSSPTINNCTITGNFAKYDGSGIHCQSGSNATITNCTISENNGTGIFGEGSLKINNSTISGNNGRGINGGPYSSLTIEGSTISGNSAGNDRGAGIYCGGDLKITNCTITGNSTESGGGGVDCRNNATIANSTISDNTGGWGGGICCGESATITNCTISGNSARWIGGIFGAIGSLTVTNCTITGNMEKEGHGGGINSYTGETMITNCILWGNQSANGHEVYVGGNANASVSYTDVQGGQADVYVGPGGVLNWGTGNIDLDPCFVDLGYWDSNGTPSDANDDFWVEGDNHLLSNSPCIDAGDPNFIPAPDETDLDGNPRVSGDAIDMGAYEFNHTPIADAGPDQTVYAWFDGIAEALLDGTYSYDDDGHRLTYLWTWTIDGNSFTAIGPNPTIELPVGEHIIELIVNDRVEDSEPDEVVITVIKPMESQLWIFPGVINRHSRMKKIMAWLRLPEGITRDQIDRDTPLVLYPGGSEAIRQFVFQYRRRGSGRTSIFAFFDKAELMGAIPENGKVELEVVGNLTSGQYFYGIDTVWIKGRRWPRWHRR